MGVGCRGSSSTFSLSLFLHPPPQLLRSSLSPFYHRCFLSFTLGPSLSPLPSPLIYEWMEKGMRGLKRERERKRENEKERGWDCMFEINHPPRRRRAATCAPTILLKHNVTRNDVKIWRGLGITRAPACIRSGPLSFLPPRLSPFFSPSRLLLSGINSGSFAGRD